jgi:inhibitor of KinA
VLAIEKSAEIIDQKKYTASMSGPAPQIRACGDCMVLVEFAPMIAPEINDAVHRLAAAVEAAAIPGVAECTPSYHSLGIHYHPLQIEFQEIVRRIGELVAHKPVSAKHPARRTVIPVVYGGDFGPDLEWVANTCGLSAEMAVAIHCEAVYRVCLIGFTPGFPYLGGLPEALAVPRLATPRTAVPAGSVAIGGQQCGIYPVKSPGGWRIIGRTPLRLFDVRRVEPCLLVPGDEVVFCSIREAEFADFATEAGAS